MLDLRRCQRGGHSGNAGHEVVHRNVDPGLQHSYQLADLLGRHGLGRHGLQIFEGLNQQWQLFLAVPVQRSLQVVAYAQALRAVKVKVTVQPPIGQGWPRVVAQAHSTAADQYNGCHERTDNGR